MTSHLMLLEHPPTLDGCCPTCKHPATFTLIGVQKWPMRVAAHINIPSQIGLYACSHCDTSVSETVLVDAQSA